MKNNNNWKRKTLKQTAIKPDDDVGFNTLRCRAAILDTNVNAGVVLLNGQCTCYTCYTWERQAPAG